MSNNYYDLKPQTQQPFDLEGMLSSLGQYGYGSQSMPGSSDMANMSIMGNYTPPADTGFMGNFGNSLSSFTDSLSKYMPSMEQAFGKMNDKGIQSGGFVSPMISALTGFGSLINSRDQMNFMKENAAKSNQFATANFNAQANMANDAGARKADYVKRNYKRDYQYTPVKGM